MDTAISDGPQALNRFISSGEIEELQDCIPPDDEYTSDNSFENGEGAAQNRVKGERDHNAELIYDKDASINQKSFIPPLMALNVLVNSNGKTERSMDQDFRIGNGDRDDREVWQTNPNNNNSNSNNSMQQQPSPWATAPNNCGGTVNNNNSNSNSNVLPPSLLNINIVPPNMSPDRQRGGTRDNYDNYQNQNSTGPGREEKRRRRDSEGRRISRFDNNERSRDRQPTTNSSSRSGRSNSKNRSSRNRRRI